MALCKNDMCKRPLKYEHWFDGYCSERCGLDAIDGTQKEDGPLLDPTDATGNRSICENRDEVDAMLAAAEIDDRLPKMIYLRKRGKTYIEIAAAMATKIHPSTCKRIMDRATRKLLLECGLRL